MIFRQRLLLRDALTKKRFRPTESIGKGILQPVEVSEDCAVCSDFTKFVSCPHAAMGLVM